MAEIVRQRRAREEGEAWEVYVAEFLRGQFERTIKGQRAECLSGTGTSQATAAGAIFALNFPLGQS